MVDSDESGEVEDDKFAEESVGLAEGSFHLFKFYIWNFALIIFLLTLFYLFASFAFKTLIIILVNFLLTFIISKKLCLLITLKTASLVKAHLLNTNNLYSVQK
jgi:hypothetical protein